MKTIWAVACVVIALGGLIVSGSGCASTTSEMKDFGRMDVGGGPGETLVRLRELQKQPYPSEGRSSSPKAGSPNSNPANSPTASIMEKPVTTGSAPTKDETAVADTSPKPPPPSPQAKANQTIPAEKPAVQDPVTNSQPPPAPKSIAPQGNSNSPSAVASATPPPLPAPAPPVAALTRPGSPASAAEENYRLGPEDVIHISVWGNQELTMDVVVRPDGKISIPLVQDVKAEGLTAGELADVIHQGLLAYIKDPSVSVIVKQVNASKYYIMGYVNKAGTYPLRGDVTILQAISMAGGFTQFASPRKIRLVRMKESRQEVRVLNYYRMIDKGGEGNYLLKPGDTIVVP